MKSSIIEIVSHFFNTYPNRTFRKGELLIRADEIPPAVFYLEKGLVKEYMITKKGDELVVNVFKPGAFFPMSWAISGQPNLYYYEALDEVSVFQAPKPAVIDFIRQQPTVLYDLIQRVFVGAEGILRRLVYLATGTATARLLIELIISAQRFGKKDGQGHIVLTMTEKDLATVCGMSRETVSRTMQLLKKRGLVETGKNQITILQLNRLENEITLIE